MGALINPRIFVKIVVEMLFFFMCASNLAFSEKMDLPDLFVSSSLWGSDSLPYGTIR